MFFLVKGLCSFLLRSSSAVSDCAGFVNRRKSGSPTKDFWTKILKNQDPPRRIWVQNRIQEVRGPLWPRGFGICFIHSLKITIRRISKKPSHLEELCHFEGLSGARETWKRLFRVVVIFGIILRPLGTPQSQKIFPTFLWDRQKSVPSFHVFGNGF